MNILIHIVTQDVAASFTGSPIGCIIVIIYNMYVITTMLATSEWIFIRGNHTQTYTQKYSYLNMENLGKD